jgi:hypothetical protein
VQTERYREIVDWIGRVGAAGAQHVMRRFGMGRSWGYARLVADGLLEQRSVLYRQARVIEPRGAELRDHFGTILPASVKRHRP